MQQDSFAPWAQTAVLQALRHNPTRNHVPVRVALNLKGFPGKGALIL